MSKGGVTRPNVAVTLVQVLLPVCCLWGESGCLRFAYHEVGGGQAGDDGGMGLVTPQDAGSTPSVMGGGGADRSGSGAGTAGSNVAGAGAGGSLASGGMDAGGMDGGAAGGGGAGSGGAGSGGQLDAAVSDAGVMDAAPLGDAGASDAAVSAPASCADFPSALFCDGFEDPNFSAWSYSRFPNGTLSLSSDVKRSGATALHATTGQASSDSEARYATTVLNQQKSGDIWLRAFYYVPSSVVVTTWFSTAVMSEITPPYDGFSLLVYNSSVGIESMSGTFPGAGTFPRDRWVCVELHVAIASSGGTFDVFLDGTNVVTSPNVPTLPKGGYTSAEVGIHYAEASQGPVEVYVDDVVVSQTRVGCQ